MCTAITYQTKNHYFGRNLDLNESYHEQVTICPRRYPLVFRHEETIQQHLAIIGMATIVDDYPLFYDATNEKGLSMAGLNFPKNAVFQHPTQQATNIASFEFIPWILSQFETVSQVKEHCKQLRLTNDAYSSAFPPAPLHWMIADAQQSIVVEATETGLTLYDNPTGVLTNNPTFDKQLFNLNNYRHLTVKTPANTFVTDLSLDAYCLGMGGLGLPGDLSSMSRFVRAVFTKWHAVSDDSEASSVNQFFHILKSVEQTKGLSYVDQANNYEYTIYSSCVNTDRGIYYYTTYDNSQVRAVDMHREDLDTSALIHYPVTNDWQPAYQN